MKYIVEIEVLAPLVSSKPIKKWATEHCESGLGWTYQRNLAAEFTSRKQADRAAKLLHGGTVVEVDA